MTSYTRLDQVTPGPDDGYVHPSGAGQCDYTIADQRWTRICRRRLLLPRGEPTVLSMTLLAVELLLGIDQLQLLLRGDDC